MDSDRGTLSGYVYVCNICKFGNNDFDKVKDHLESFHYVERITDTVAYISVLNPLTSNVLTDSSSNSVLDNGEESEESVTRSSSPKDNDLTLDTEIGKQIHNNNSTGSRSFSYMLGPNERFNEDGILEIIVSSGPCSPVENSHDSVDILFQRRTTPLPEIGYLNVEDEDELSQSPLPITGNYKLYKNGKLVLDAPIAYPPKSASINRISTSNGLGTENIDPNHSDVNEQENPSLAYNYLEKSFRHKRDEIIEQSKKHLPTGYFKDQFVFQSIQFENYSSLSSCWSMEDLEGYRGATIFAKSGSTQLPGLVIQGILDSVGMLGKCCSSPENNSEHTNSTGRITISLLVLGNKTKQWTELTIVKKYDYADGTISAFVHDKPECSFEDDVLVDVLGLDFPYPKLMYLCESNLQWLMEHKSNWGQMRNTIISQKFKHNSAATLKLKSRNVDEKDDTKYKASRDNLIHRFNTVYKEVLNAEGLEGIVSEDAEDVKYFDVFVTPRGTKSINLENSEKLVKCMKTTNDDDVDEQTMNRAAGIAVFLSFWSIMGKVPFMVCDILTSGVGKSDGVGIKGIRYFLKNLQKRNKMISSTQQLFFTSPDKDSLDLKLRA